MKKLMIGLAAAGLCGAVFADVTSANVVGYQNSETLNGGNTRTLITPTFSTINAGKAIKLKDLKPVCTTASVRKNQITLGQMTNMGKTIPALDAKWNGTNGWTTNNVDASEMEIPEGTGLYITCGVAAANAVQLQSAGQVNTTDDAVFLLNGGNTRTAIGNPFPVAVTLANFVPECLTAGQTVRKNQITIGQLTNMGKTIPALDAKWNGTNGWTTNNVPANSMTIPAGHGLYITCGVAEATTRVNLRIKNPLKKVVE